MPHHIHHLSAGGRRTVASLGTAAALSLVPATFASAATARATQPGGASGTVAALTPTANSMEVQNASTGQTTVIWTPTTAFSKVVTVLVSAVAPGDCLTVTGTAAKKSKATIAARSITIIPAPASGTCAGPSSARRIPGPSGPGGPGGPGANLPAGGRGFAFGGGSGSGSGGGSKSGTKRTLPAGGQRARFPATLANLAVASGKVTSVSNGTVTLSGYLLNSLFTARAAPAQKSSKSTKSTKAPRKAPTPKKQTFKITTSKSATLSETQTVTSAALAVGQCVTAFGQASSTGAVTASRVSITSSGGSTCSTRFGGRFGPGGGGFGGPPPGVGA